MQLGFVTAILPELSLEEVLLQAAQIGYDCVEVMCWPKGKAARRYAGVTHIDVADLTKKKAKTINKLCQVTGVSISGLGYYPNPLVASKKERNVYINHLKRVIDAAVLLNLDVVNTFIGRDHTRTIEENWSNLLEVWNPIIAYAEKKKIKIGIENCPMKFTKDEWPGGKNLAISPSVWRNMFEAISSPYFGLNFDPSHLVWQQIDYLAAIRNFGHRFHHVHAKDVTVDRHRLNEVGILAHPNLWHTPKLPGLGDVNWGKFFASLNEVGYKGAVCVEVEDRAYEGSLEQRLLSLRISYSYLAPYFGK